MWPGLNTMRNNCVLVTGAGDGIGFQLVKIFIKNGFDVIGHYHTSPNNLKKIKSDQLKLIQCDFENPYILYDFLAQCDQIGDVDILINNAAYYEYAKNKYEIDLKVIEKYLNVNLVTPYMLCQHFSKLMRGRKKGNIINISSVSVKHGGSLNSAFYTITKSAIEQMTRTLSKDYAKNNININSFRIGMVNTKFHKKNPNKNISEREKLIPLRRMASPEEIAKIIFNYTKLDFNYVTGAVVEITGGE